MRRLFAILLLTLLPLQFSWAAVAGYCGHETGTQTRHLGHHEHQHAEADGAAHDAAPAEQGAPAVFDFDCGNCHGTSAGLPAPVDDTAPLTPASRPATPVEGSVRTLAHSPPDRPQWPALA